MLLSVRDERVHVVAREALSALEERQLDHEFHADDLSAEPLDEVPRSPRRPARGEHVVVESRPCAVGDRVGGTSSEFSPYSSTYGPHGLRRELAGRRAGTKPQPTSLAIAAPRMKPRASAPRTRSGLPAPRPGREFVDGLRDAAGRQERRDVLEADPRLREVRDLADVAFRSRAVTRRELRTLRAKRSCDSSCAASERAWSSLSRRPAPFGVARAERGRDDRLEERRFPVGRRAECAQMARRDPEARKRAQEIATSRSLSE